MRVDAISTGRSVSHSVRAEIVCRSTVSARICCTMGGASGGKHGANAPLNGAANCDIIITLDNPGPICYDISMTYRGLPQMTDPENQYRPAEAQNEPLSGHLGLGHYIPEKPEMATSEPRWAALARFWADCRAGLDLARQIRAEVASQKAHKRSVK